ncbi:MAG: hypothetical protein RBT38_10860, partial [Bacteroidales bacterium]|nr:hypothetical protein [Bacteroidales bacterium]
MDTIYITKRNNLKGIALAGLIILAGILQNASAQTVEAFTQRTSVYTPTQKIYSIKGDFTMIGNKNLTRAVYEDESSNSNSTMVYVDVDGDVNTLNSSSATLQFSDENGAIPACSNIIYAGLYWTGRAHDGGSSPLYFTVGGTTSNYYNTNTVNGYALAISQTGFGPRIATYTFTPASGDAVVFTVSTNSDETVNSVRVQVGSGSQVDLGYSSTFGSYNVEDWVLVTFDTPYIINTGSTTITVNNLRKSNENNTIDTDFRANVTYGGKFLSKLQVKLKHGTDSYQTVTANSSDIYYPSNEYGNMYAAYAEVTDYVKTHGLGEYTVADIALVEGNGTSTGFYGGWGITIVYENSAMNWRDVTIFDGYAYVPGSTTYSAELPVSGFNTAQSGQINMKLGMMAGEGDRTISGDYFQIIDQSSTWVNLSHGGNATNNFFNSSIYTGGNPRNPNELNNFGMDVSMFYIDNPDNSIITNNQTSTTFKYGTTQDTYIIYCIAMAVDAYRPEIEGLNTVVEVNGNPYSYSEPATAVYPNDIIEYTVDIANLGSESINNGRLLIPIPYTVEFNGVSFENYHLVGYETPVYDASEGANGSIVWDLGTLPIPPDAGTKLATLTFTLKVTDDCRILALSLGCEFEVSVDGTISGVGAVSGVPVSSSLIQGYESAGECQGIAIGDPIVIPVDAVEYFNANCQGTPAVPEFYYCNTGATIPVTDVLGNFPPGTRFYDETWTTEYTISNPFPAIPGTTTYRAVPPGVAADPEPGECSYTFKIIVTILNTSPTPVNPTYCMGDVASPLTATATNSDYTLYYYTTATGGSAQTSITPSTVTPGTTTYWVAEGLSGDCIGPREEITVTVANCSITLEKTGAWVDGDSDGYPQAGEVINYIFTVTNNSPVTLVNVTVTDPKPNLSIFGGPVTLAPGETNSTTFTGTYTLTQADIDAGQVDNTASVSGENPSGSTLTDSDDESVPLLKMPALTIDKSADVSTYDAVDDVITYTYVVRNTGNLTLTNVTVEDDNIDAGSLDPASVATLAPGAEATFTATRTITQTDLDEGSVVNVAYATDGTTDSPTDTETVTTDEMPALTIDKSADVSTYDAVDDVITYTYVVRNTGNLTLTNVTV